MGEPGFWDDQERAAGVSAEHSRASRKLSEFRALESDVVDLEPLAELAEEDPEIASELEEQIASVQARLDELEEARLFSGRYDNEVYVFDTKSGALTHRIPVGREPHGLCVWPQPGRYSLVHTGNMR